MEKTQNTCQKSVSDKKNYPVTKTVADSMSVDDVVRGVHAGKIYWTALIGRNDGKGEKDGKVGKTEKDDYDIISAWWVQFENPAPRDFSWPLRPVSAPPAKARPAPAMDGFNDDLLDPANAVDDWPGVSGV